MTRRVVITGLGALSPIGTTWEDARNALQQGRSGIELTEDWQAIEGIDSYLVGAVDLETDELEEGLDPRTLRKAGRVALLSIHAVRTALEDAGLLDEPILSDGRTGVSYGSTEGNDKATSKFTQEIKQRNSVERIKVSDFLKSMSHTCPANIAHHFNLAGRLISTSTACTSGSQGIGYGYEAVKYGKQDVMITGGAEELVMAAAAVFNTMFGASTRNEMPATAPRPFDRDRDGLVVSEGAGALILEERQNALDRGAPVYGEVLGYGDRCDGQHPTIPSADGMKPVMNRALEDADLDPDEVDYLNAHATATDRGDIEESKATREVLGPDVPISSLKGHMGHTLGSCGAVETVYALRMAREGWLAPTLHLEHPDDRCADLHYISGEPIETSPDIIMNNNFAFGGVNTSLLFRLLSS